MKKSIFLFILTAFLANIVMAVPADPSPKTITTKDGRQLTFTTVGDEFSHISRTMDGYTIFCDDNGNWVYGKLDDKNFLIASNITACNPEQRTSVEIVFLSTIS